MGEPVGNPASKLKQQSGPRGLADGSLEQVLRTANEEVNVCFGALIVIESNVFPSAHDQAGEKQQTSRFFQFPSIGTLNLFIQ